MVTLQVLRNGSVLSRRELGDEVEKAVVNYLVPADITTGSYFTPDGRVARVRKSKAERFYAEMFNEAEMKFVYMPGLVYHLGKRMTLEEAKAWGARVGHCCVCGKLLTDNRSVEAGIGPVCITKI